MTRVSRLPDVVPLRPGSIELHAHNRADVQRLALTLQGLSDQVGAYVAAGMIAERVMIPALPVRLAAWIGRRKMRKLPCAFDEMTFFATLFGWDDRGRAVMRSVLSDAAKWAVRGKDREQPDSVGGFSQREINFITGLIATVEDVIEAEQSVAA